jgi:uncharacterized integral membrane protein
MRGFLKALVIVPLAALLTLFAVVNRAPVELTFDPLEWSGMGERIAVPLFVVIFLSAAVGVIIGGVAMWFGQGRHRKAARANARAAARHLAELERLRPAVEADSLPPPASTLR